MPFRTPESGGNTRDRSNSITVRERRKEDDPHDHGRLQFRGPEGKPVERGEAEVFPGRLEVLLKSEIERGVSVPDCPLELIVSVQAPG